MAKKGEVPIADMQEERSWATVDGSAVGTLCFVSINPSFLPSFLHETLRMIDHLCGPGRAENKERYRKYSPAP